MVGSSATWGLSLPFDPGPHRLAIAAPGYPTASIEVVLVEGQTATLAVGPARPGTVAEGAGAALGPGPWVVGGIGVVGLVVGGVLGGMVLAKRSDVSAGCNEATRTCTPAGKSAAQAGATLGPLSTVGFVLGGAGLAAAGIWIGVSRAGDKKATAGISVRPVAGGGLVHVGGTW